MIWTVVLALAAINAALKAVGPALLGGLPLPPRAAAVFALLAPALLIDIERAVGLRDALEQLGLIEATTSRITDRGRSELRAQKRARRRTTSGIFGSNEPYYPMQLR